MRVSGWIVVAVLATVSVSATAKSKKKSEPVSKLFCPLSHRFAGRLDSGRSPPDHTTSGVRNCQMTFL